MRDAALRRRRLGALCAVFGALALAPLALTWLSSYGPAAFVLTAAQWSRLYFGLFIGLVVLGYGGILLDAAKTKIFHGGPMLDFTIGLGLLVIASSFGRTWIPGAFLTAFGLRLATGRALL